MEQLSVWVGTGLITAGVSAALLAGAGAATADSGGTGESGASSSSDARGSGATGSDASGSEPSREKPQPKPVADESASAKPDATVGSTADTNATASAPDTAKGGTTAADPQPNGHHERTRRTASTPPAKSTSAEPKATPATTEVNGVRRRKNEHRIGCESRCAETLSSPVTSAAAPVAPAPPTLLGVVQGVARRRRRQRRIPRVQHTCRRWKP